MRIKVAKTTDLESGGCMSLQANGQDIALYHIEGQFFASSNRCPHRGGPLGEGTMDEKIVTCPWHGWQFNVCTGHSTSHEGAALKTYAVTLEGNDVFIEL